MKQHQVFVEMPLCNYYYRHNSYQLIRSQLEPSTALKYKLLQKIPYSVIDQNIPENINQTCLSSKVAYLLPASKCTYKLTTGRVDILTICYEERSRQQLDLSFQLSTN